MGNEAQEAQVFELKISHGRDASADQVDDLTRQLFGELGELGVESVTYPTGEPSPEGVKSAEAITIGALAVAVLPGFLPKLVEYLQSWTMRGENRRVRIKSQIGDRSIEIEYSPAAMSTEELNRLVDSLSGSLKNGEKTG